MSQRTIKTLFGVAIVALLGISALLYLFHPKPEPIPTGYPMAIVRNSHRQLVPAVNARAPSPRIGKGLHAVMLDSSTGDVASIVLAYFRTARAISGTKDPLTKNHIIRFNLNFTPDHSWVLPWRKSYGSGIDSIESNFFASKKLDNLAYHIMKRWVGGTNYRQVISSYLGYSSGHESVDYRYAIVNLDRQLLSRIYLAGFQRSGKFKPMPNIIKVKKMIASRGKAATAKFLTDRLRNDISATTAFLNAQKTGSQQKSNQNAFVAVNYFIGPAAVFAYEYGKIFGLPISVQ